MNRDKFVNIIMYTFITFLLGDNSYFLKVIGEFHARISIGYRVIGCT